MASTTMVLLEACIDSVASARAAERGGAARVELCADLSNGGTTPSAGMIEAVSSAVGIPVYVIVRPRGGDFVYTRDELDVMQRDARAAWEAGAAGVVVGVLLADGTVDAARTQAVIQAAGGLPATFHRAFDLVVNRQSALETLIGMGVERVLTSGGAAAAAEGVVELRRLVAQSDGRIMVMAGGGLRESNIGQVVRQTGVREAHVRGTRTVPGVPHHGPVRFRKPPLDEEGAWEETDEGRIAEMVRVVNGTSGSHFP